MKIYAISGLGADQRIFSHLKLDYELIPIHWIEPQPDESLTDYALRLAEQIDRSEEFAVLGVSFGGMLATEIATVFSPKVTLLISSAATYHELPILASWAHKWGCVRKIPTRWFRPPALAAWIGFPFDSSNRRVAQGIIRDMDPHFVKWALGAIVAWKNEDKPEPLYHLHGRLDPILPLKNQMQADKLGIGHFIILKEAEKVSDWINSRINCLIESE